VPVRPADLPSAAVGALFAALAALRRGRALHPHGLAYRARVILDGGPGATLLSRPGEYPAEVRFSRALGLPRRWPDLLGVGVRIHGPDGPQDVLVTSSGSRPRLRRIFLPARDFQQRPYTSALPYEAGGARCVLYVLPVPGAPCGDGPSDLARLAGAAETGALTFRLAAAAPRGPMRVLGSVRVGAPLPDDGAVRLHPYTGELRPVGLINALRRRAYPMSQAVWSRTQRSGSEPEPRSPSDAGSRR
jgi:hypothetical protein